jgi:hypothetical protein
MNRYSYCLNNPLRYIDPSGYKKAPVKEDAFIMDYANYWNRRTLYGGGSGSSLNSTFSGGSGGPGGRNGTGLNGAYYDHSSSTYRSTGTGNPEVGWDYALSVAQNYASERWWRQDAYAGSSGEMAYKGSIWKYSSSFTSVENIGRNIGGDFFWGGLAFTEKHFNGGLGTVGVSIQGYGKIPNDIKRAYAHKLFKMTGIKSGRIFQGVKSFTNSTGKLVSKLGPVGTVLGGGVITYEVLSGTWDTHTAVNTGLMIGAGVATFFAAPAVLTGIAIYGVGDYFFDFGGTIDKTVGRNSEVWRP